MRPKPLQDGHQPRQNDGPRLRKAKTRPHPRGKTMDEVLLQQDTMLRPHKPVRQGAETGCDPLDMAIFGDDSSQTLMRPLTARNCGL